MVARAGDCIHTQEVKSEQEVEPSYQTSRPDPRDSSKASPPKSSTTFLNGWRSHVQTHEPIGDISHLSYNTMPLHKGFYRFRHL